MLRNTILWSALAIIAIQVSQVSALSASQKVSEPGRATQPRGSPRPATVEKRGPDQNFGVQFGGPPRNNLFMDFLLNPHPERVILRPGQLAKESEPYPYKGYDFFDAEWRLAHGLEEPRLLNVTAPSKRPSVQKDTEGDKKPDSQEATNQKSTDGSGERALQRRSSKGQNPVDSSAVIDPNGYIQTLQEWKLNRKLFGDTGQFWWPSSTLAMCFPGGGNYGGVRLCYDYFVSLGGATIRTSKKKLQTDCAAYYEGTWTSIISTPYRGATASATAASIAKGLRFVLDACPSYNCKDSKCIVGGQNTALDQGDFIITVVDGLQQPDWIPKKWRKLRNRREKVIKKTADKIWKKVGYNPPPDFED